MPTIALACNTVACAARNGGHVVVGSDETLQIALAAIVGFTLSNTLLAWQSRRTRYITNIERDLITR